MPRVRKKASPVKRTTWNIAFYIRLSKDDGNDESLSVGNQRKILFEYVQNLFKEEYTIVNIYIDDGKTGTDVNRPDFMRMERDIREGKINCVIVKSLARAFRNLGDQQKYLEEFFPLNGVRFICLGNPFIDTHINPRSVCGLEVPIHGLFNEQFAANTSEEVRRTLNTKRRKGEFIGAFAPYGYKKHPENKNYLIVDEEASMVVKDIFTWFLYGLESNLGSLSINGIAKELNERGIPCPSKYKQQKGFNYYNPNTFYKECFWTGTTISRILKDRIYTGCMVQGKYRVISYKVHKQIKTDEKEWFVVEDTHEPVIKKEMFLEVQKRLERDTRTAPGKKELYLFSGLLQCADCGRSLHRKTSKNHVYYFCRSKQLLYKDCAKRTIRIKDLEGIVLDTINLQLSLVENFGESFSKIKNKRLNNQYTSLRLILKKHEKEQLKLIKLSDGLYVDWKNGDFTKEEYLRMKLEFSKRRKEVESALEKIRNECNFYDRIQSSEHPYLLELKLNERFDSLRRDMLIDLIDTILVHENNTLTIKFKYSDTLE